VSIFKEYLLCLYVHFLAVEVNVGAIVGAQI